MTDAWQSLTKDGSALALKYKFGVGQANTFAVKHDDGSWIVVSPAMRVGDAAIEELAAKGPVCALIANNAYHHMGQALWRKRFPQAKSYAPTGALDRLRKKAAAGIEWHDLDALKLPSRIQMLVAEGSKAPDLLVGASAPDGTVWFTGDMLSNMQPGDLGAVPRFIFHLLGAKDGYAFNPVPAIVYLKDRAAWKRAVLSAMEKAPPDVVLPAHGAPVRERVLEQSRQALA